jgi:hypothetical protein
MNLHRVITGENGMALEWIDCDPGSSMMNGTIRSQCGSSQTNMANQRRFVSPALHARSIAFGHDDRRDCALDEAGL